jgi:DNA-binding NarL/FixJ family response regulator
MMKAIRLLFIEDNHLFRRGIASMLARERGTKIVNAGTSGFILKDATPDDFLKAIRAVAKGVIVLPLFS